MTGWRGCVAFTCLVPLLLFGGCSRGSASKAQEIHTTPTEREEAALMRQIDRRFENPAAHYELGHLYQDQGLWAQAEYEYKVALSFDPAHRPAQAGMIYILQGSGDKEKAASTADIYISHVSGSAEESLKLGLAFQKEKLDDLALTCYEQAVRLAPNSAITNRQIGYYYYSRGDMTRARQFLQRSFQIDPGQDKVARELGRLGVDTTGYRTLKRTTKMDKIVTDAEEKKN